MNIILLERIEKLGSIGDVVTVKDGYARNFLLPQKKALRANEANKKVFEANRERLVTENAERRTAADPRRFERRSALWFGQRARHRVGPRRSGP
jgi:large subunit ribosomal protein L9